MAEPRERPLIFGAPKVRYILGLPVGAIFQTRRVVKPQPPALVSKFAQILDSEWWKPCWSLPPFEGEGTLAGIGTPAHKAALAEMDRQFEEDGNVTRRCPCGVPGDRVWGKETYALVDDASDWIPRERMGPTSPVKGAAGRRSVTWRAVYRADGELHNPVTGHHLKWASPRFMPRYASRILAELVEVRVQRLQEISEEDAQAEGFASVFEQFPTMHHEQNFASRAGDGAQLERFADRPCAASFAIAWDEINGKRAPWVSNPWVWAYTLRKLEAPHA